MVEQFQYAAGRRARRPDGVARRRRQGQRQLRHPAERRAHQRPARQLHEHPEELGCLDASPVVEAMRDILPEIQATAPEGLELKLDFDQSVFVQGAVDNIVHEAILSSILVSLMILIFLGSWRNTVIVSLSIPLSIAAGLAGLFLDRPDHQPDDARRPGARHRPSGRQRHGDDREHPPQPGARQAADRRHPRRLERGDPAADGRDAGDLHRVLPGAAADRAVALPVHPARHHRRAGDAGVLRAVVHRRSGAGALSAQGPRRPRRRRTSARACRLRSTAASSASRTATATCWRWRCRSGSSCSAASRC